MNDYDSTNWFWIVNGQDIESSLVQHAQAAHDRQCWRCGMTTF